MIDLSEFSPKKLSKASLAVFLVATYGEGEPPDSAKEFCEWLVSSNPAPSSEGESDLSRMLYAVFALGNSCYESFCAAGKLVDGALEGKGASRIAPLGIGDAIDCIEQDFDKWTESVLPILEAAVTTL